MISTFILQSLLIRPDEIAVPGEEIMLIANVRENLPTCDSVEYVHYRGSFVFG